MNCVSGFRLIIMFVIGGCRHLKCITKILKSYNHNVKICRRDDIYLYRKIYTSATILFLQDERYKVSNHRSKQLYKIETPTVFRRKLEVPCIAFQNKSYSIAARIVESSPKKIQPYMKLMRIDKPIGKQFLVSLPHMVK